MAGLILEAQGKGEEARRRYERLSRWLRGRRSASNNLAWMYASRGRATRPGAPAGAGCESRLPGEPDVNDTLALVYIKKQLGSLAVPLLRLALEKRPDEPAFHYHLGLAYAQVATRPRRAWRWKRRSS